MLLDQSSRLASLCFSSAVPPYEVRVHTKILDQCYLADGSTRVASVPGSTQFNFDDSGRKDGLCGADDQ